MVQLEKMQPPPADESSPASNISTKIATKISATKLKDVAHQFEASLMQELMEPLQHDASGAEDDPDDHDASTDALGSFAREAMARALSAQGGFGIANSIVHYFEKTGKLE